MKWILSILFFLPFATTAQKIRINEFDKFIKKQRVETYPLSLVNATHMKMSVCLSAIGSQLYVQLVGAGVGANRLEPQDRVIFLMSNDSTITVKSKGYQSFEIGATTSSYKHHYILTYADLMRLSQFSLAALRKYHSEDYDDVEVPDEVSAKFRQLCAVFIEELDKSQLLDAVRAGEPEPPLEGKDHAVAAQKPTVDSPVREEPVRATTVAPAFPGGKDVWTAFLQRNLNPPPELMSGESKVVMVQFQVAADGSVSDIRIVQTGGPAFDKEVLRVLKRMPKWKCAIENGRPVDATVTQSVTFYKKEPSGVL